MKWYCKKLFGVVVIGLLFISMSVATASAAASAVLYDGDARSFTDAPDTIAYANTEHTASPSEFQITTSGSIWRYHQWIALMERGTYVEARTTVATDTVGIQFWGDTNDGWARVLIDGTEVWTGNTYGSDVGYPGGAFVKYLKVSGLSSSTHTIRVECMGTSGAGGGDDVTIMFFGLEDEAENCVVLLDGDVRSFTDAPGIIAYANTEHTASPSEFRITTSGETWPSGPIWRYHQWIALMERGSYVEARTTVATDTVGVQFWGDTNDGWARVLVDGSEVWTGSVYGTDVNYPGGSFVKYLEIGCLDSSTHTIRVENMGINGAGGGDDVTILLFGLEGESSTTTSTSGSGLVAYYPFEGDTKDKSGNGNDGTNNGATFVSGISGKALDLDGTNDYIYLPVNINPDVMPRMTVTLWVKSDSDSQGTVISHDNGGFDRSIDIDSRGGGVGWSAFSGTGAVLGYQPVTTGKWTFLAAVYDQDAATVKLYVDDTRYEESGSLSTGWDYTHLGSNPSFGSYFNGVMDEVRIYNYALSQSEVNSIYEGETVPPADDITPPSTAGFSGLIFESRSKSSGSSVQIPLTLSGIDENIGNMDITLSYDSSVLEATEVIKGGLTTNSLFDYNIVDDTIKISLADKNGFSGDGSIAYVKFDVVGAEGSSSPLEITKLSANRADDLSVINIPTLDGVFEVVSIEESLGDVDGDGEYTAVDALYALQMAVGKIPEDLIMDMNGDGQVSSIDARKILRIAAGLETI